MTLCPIALAVGCKKCPAFKICPAKGLIGDAPPASVQAPAPAPQARVKARTRAATKSRAAATRKKK